MNKITKQDIVTLESQDDETLADWWCELNLWEWPEELPGVEEKKAWRPSAEGSCRRWAIMNWIRDQVGDKLCSWQWNKERMTKPEHDAWYRKTFRRSGKPTSRRSI